MKRLLLMLLLLFLAACQANRPHPLTTPDPGDLKKRAKLQGCQLIPYDSRRSTCVTNNTGLHTPQACNATACAGNNRQTNRTRLAAWQNCVTRRTAINGSFSATVNALEKIKRSSIWKGWDRKTKDAVNEIIQKINLGTPTHVGQLNVAKGQVAHCKTLPH